MEPNGGEVCWVSQGKGRKKRRKRKEKEEEGPEVVEERLLEASRELQTSDFWDSAKRTVLKRIRDHLAPLPAIENLRLAKPKPETRPRESEEDRALCCVCYGAGSFSSCATARYQLAFLMALLEELRIPRHLCDVFDPAFNAVEVRALRRLGFAVVAENEEGKRRVRGPTVFYMIHCGKALYNNLLWRNWEPEALAKMAVIGNSFHSIAERMPRRTFEKEYAYIAKVSLATDEAAFPPDLCFQDVFSDTAVHCFPASKLRVLPPETWTPPEEPVYRTEDLEIVRKQP